MSCSGVPEHGNTLRGVWGLPVEPQPPALRDVLELAAWGYGGRMEPIEFNTVSEIWQASPPVALVRCGRCGAAIAVARDDAAPFASHIEWHERLEGRLDDLERFLDRRPPWSVEQWSGMPLEREVGSVSTGPTERGREAIARRSAQGDRAAQ